MPNITHRQGEANQNHEEVSPHTCCSDCWKKDKKKKRSVGEATEQREPHAQFVGQSLVQPPPHSH